MTDDLILRLSSGVRPAPRHAVALRLAFGLGAGFAVSAALLAATLGFRPDMQAAAAGEVFWLKLAYALALGGVGFWSCERLARPGGDARRRLAWIAAPLAVVAILAALELAGAPAEARRPMLMGGSAKVCPWAILAFSLPPLVGMILAMRSLAPTRLRVAGFLIGLAAGGAGAAAYALYCNEHTMAFLAVWYSLGIAASAVLGALLGPKLLRW